MKKNEKGITLIALVITIIVLLILAGVSINMALGENGIITRSQNAKERYEYATAKEIIELKVANLDMERIIEGTDVSELQYLANGLHPNVDLDMEYVDVATRIASTSNILIGDSISSIFVKLKAYKYEFEIDRNSTIVGVKDSDGNDVMEEFEIKWITEEENGELTIIGAYVETRADKERDTTVFGVDTLVFPSSINGKPVKKVEFQKVVCDDVEYTNFYLHNVDFESIVVEEGIEEFGLGRYLYIGGSISLPKSLTTIGSGWISCNTLLLPNGSNDNFPLEELLNSLSVRNKIVSEGIEIE